MQIFHLSIYILIISSIENTCTSLGMDLDKIYSDN